MKTNQFSQKQILECAKRYSENRKKNCNNSLLHKEVEDFAKEYKKDMSNWFFEIVSDTADALDFLEYHKDKKMLYERLREYTVGSLVNNSVMVDRANARGICLSYFNPETKEISTGVSYLNTTENYFMPTIGVAEALKDALANAEDKKPIKDEYKSQYNHFVMRSKAYFLPEVYSYSRGSNPLDYFDKNLDKRQKLIKADKSIFLK